MVLVGLGLMDWVEWLIDSDMGGISSVVGIGIVGMYGGQGNKDDIVDGEHTLCEMVRSASGVIDNG